MSRSRSSRWLDSSAKKRRKRLTRSLLLPKNCKWGVRSSGQHGHSKWELPVDGSVKVNFDAALLAGIGVGLGVVIRDGVGRVLAASVKRVPACDVPVILAEAIAARYGVLIAKQLQFGRVELEGGALAVINAIKLGQVGRSPLDLVIEDIKEKGKGFTSCSTIHVKRCRNATAHYAARLLPPVGSNFVFLDSIPQGLLALAELDLA